MMLCCCSCSASRCSSCSRLLPGDPARLTCGKACTPQIIEANRHRLGLDEPILIQYWKFFSGLFVGRTF